MTYWETPIPKIRILLIFGVATVMTVLAEFFYFTVWGLWFFPDGNLVSKATWTLICGVAMGITIGAGTLLLVEGNSVERRAILLASTIMSVVGIGCAILCSQIDQHFNYFGGREHPLMFILSGTVPALAGGILYGWLLYSSQFLTWISIQPHQSN